MRVRFFFFYGFLNCTLHIHNMHFYPPALSRDEPLCTWAPLSPLTTTAVDLRATELIVIHYIIIMTEKIFQTSKRRQGIYYENFISTNMTYRYYNKFLNAYIYQFNLYYKRFKMASTKWMENHFYDFF